MYLSFSRSESIIEQFRSLLGPEFFKKDPDCKMEKADILKMTVEFDHGSSVSC